MSAWKETPKRKLKVDIGMLEDAFSYHDPWGMSRHYLDLETGQVILITEDALLELERTRQEVHDPASEEPIDSEQVLEQLDLPERKREELLVADRDYGDRYVPIPQDESRQAYRDMKAFIATIGNPQLQDRLRDAINGRGAFRAFKDVLYDYPDERERWFEFKQARLRQRILGWLESVGIEPIIEAPLVPPPEPPAASTRSRLIAEVLAFMRAVVGEHEDTPLPGVIRIALIGSLATGKPDPRDVDLLVTVTDDMDLAPLAKLARRLQGRAQGLGRGADVFLADPQGHYLGRTCPWKRCGPGIRTRCEALHCGRRPYLHDDLHNLTLPRELIQAPPIELWPEVITRVAVPQDLEQGLLAPLRRS